MRAEGAAGGGRRAEASGLRVSGRVPRGRCRRLTARDRSRLAVPAARRSPQRRARVRGRVEAAARRSIPAETAMAYLSVARGNEKDAATRFERALQADTPVRAGLDWPRPGDARARSRCGRAGELRSGAREGSVADRPSQPRRCAEVPRDPGLLARAKSAADARRWDEAAGDLPAGDRRIAGFSVSLSRPGGGRTARRADRERPRALPEGRRDRLRAMRDRSRASPRSSRARATSLGALADV